jgi:hypothetical protein
MVVVVVVVVVVMVVVVMMMMTTMITRERTPPAMVCTLLQDTYSLLHLKHSLSRRSVITIHEGNHFLHHFHNTGSSVAKRRS